MQRLQILFSLVIFSFVMAGCGDTGSKKIPTDVVSNPSSADGFKSKSPQITFEKTEHDFGRIIQGERLVYRFRFTNTGSQDLLITKVSSSCGCTVGKYPKEPVAPGKTGDIEVSFDSAGRKGIQNKSVTVLTNANPNRVDLRIKGNIVTPEKN